MGVNYRISDKGIERLNHQFTMSYAYDQWFFKLKTYEFILENTEKFISEFADDEFKQKDIEAYKLAIKTEIVFSFFHMSEALFSLMYCCRYSSIPWLDMTEIKFEKICSYVRDEIVSGKITDEDIRFLFFNGVMGDEAKKDIVINSINFIKEFLKRAGKIFLKNEIYNEYKHGLRLMPTNAHLQITPENVENPQTFTIGSGNAHVFLSKELLKKEGKEDFYKLKHNTKGFDYELYLRLSREIYCLISNLFNTRRQKTKLKPGDQMEVCIFTKDIKEVFKENPSTMFSFNIDYI